VKWAPRSRSVAGKIGSSGAGGAEGQVEPAVMKGMPPGVRFKNAHSGLGRLVPSASRRSGGATPECPDGKAFGNPRTRAGNDPTQTQERPPAAERVPSEKGHQRHVDFYTEMMGLQPKKRCNFD